MGKIHWLGAVHSKMSLNSCRLKGLNLTSIDKLHRTQVKFLLDPSGVL